MAFDLSGFDVNLAIGSAVRSHVKFISRGGNFSSRAISREMARYADFVRGCCAIFSREFADCCFRVLSKCGIFVVSFRILFIRYFLLFYNRKHKQSKFFEILFQ